MKLPHLVFGVGLFLLLMARARADDINELLSAVRNAGDVDGDGTDDLMIADRALSPGSVRVISGKSREQLLVLRSQAATESLPASMDRLGDLNGDGKSEMIVCWRPDYSTEPLNGGWRGHACVYSGRDGRVLHKFAGAWTAALAGDTNADGTPDILLGVGPFFSITEPPGPVQVRSGRDGSLLLEKFGRAPSTNECGQFQPGDNFGVALAGLGDVDGDGHGDFVVGAPGEPTNLFSSPTSIEIFSGRDGHSIARFEGPSDGRDSRAWSIIPIDDFDEDGARDLLVGSLHTAAAVRSGRDLHLIRRSTGRGRLGPADSFAASLDVLGDIDGDGLSEWIVGANGNWSKGGYAQVHSSRDGELLRIDFDCRRVGVDVCSLGDIDGDGMSDEAIGCPSRSWVRLISGRTGELIEKIDLAKLREPAATKPR